MVLVFQPVARSHGSSPSPRPLQAARPSARAARIDAGIEGGRHPRRRRRGSRRGRSARSSSANRTRARRRRSRPRSACSMTRDHALLRHPVPRPHARRHRVHAAHARCRSRDATTTSPSSSTRSSTTATGSSLRSTRPVRGATARSPTTREHMTRDWDGIWDAAARITDDGLGGRDRDPVQDAPLQAGSDRVGPERRAPDQAPERNRPLGQPAARHLDHQPRRGGPARGLDGIQPGPGPRHPARTCRAARRTSDGKFEAGSTSSRISRRT